MPWTKEQVATLIASIEHGPTKVHNLLLELSATSAAVENLSRTHRTVWFTDGFTPEQQAQRTAIISIAESILSLHRDDWIAVLLNTLQVPPPQPEH